MPRIHGGRGEKGATLVEFAFVVPILLLLIFGAIDFGVTYNNQQTLRNSVREAGRRAIVGPDKVAEDGCTTVGDVGCLVKARADMGDLAGDEMLTMVCFPDSETAPSCPVGNAGDKSIGDVIRICAIYPVESVTGLLDPFIGGRRLTSRVDLRLEQPWPAAYTDTDPDPNQRGTWDFCSA